MSVCRAPTDTNTLSAIATHLPFSASASPKRNPIHAFLASQSTGVIGGAVEDQLAFLRGLVRHRCPPCRAWRLPLTSKLSEHVPTNACPAVLSAAASCNAALRNDDSLPSALGPPQQLEDVRLHGVYRFLICGPSPQPARLPFLAVASTRVMK